MATEKKLVPREAGEILGLSGPTVVKRAKEGHLRYSVTGRTEQLRFDRKDVEAYKKKLDLERAKKQIAEEARQLRKKKRELSPLQKKHRDQMRRPMFDRVNSCVTGTNRFVDAFETEELLELLPDRKLRWIVLLPHMTLGNAIHEEAVVDRRGLTIDEERRTISFRERDERRFRTVYLDRVYGVK